MVASLGSGAYGVVEKYRHQPSGTIMAVKVSINEAMITHKLPKISDSKQNLKQTWNPVFIYKCNW